jgi:hypothetical protein
VYEMQRCSKLIVTGVDDGVKTIYSPPPLPLGADHSTQGFIVKSRHIVTTHRPALGPVAFVRAAAMQPTVACDAAMALDFPSSNRWLDRAEDQVHPGEGGA